MNRLKMLSVVVMLIGFSEFVLAQPIHKPHRILVILNGSAGMGGNGQATRYRQASQFIAGLAEEMYRHNDDIQFGLRVYGHLFPLSYNICKDSRLEVRFSKENFSQLDLRLQDIKPAGKGALSFAFTEAVVNELADTARYQYSLIVLSDTGRQCQADNCLPIHPVAQGLYRKYLVEFGRTTPATCYDSVFSGDVAGYRPAIDYIIFQYPVKGAATIIPPPVKADTIRIPIYTRRQLPKVDAPRMDTVQTGTAVIYNTSQLYTIVLHAEFREGFRRMEEVFFSGAASKTIHLSPGKYKAAFMANGVEHSRFFTIEKGKTIDVRVE